MRLEVSKKVLLVHLPQGAAKLQAVKLLVFQKIKSVHRWRCFHMTIRDTERANFDKQKTLENVKLVTFPWNMIKLEHFLTRIHFQNAILM